MIDFKKELENLHITVDFDNQEFKLLMAKTNKTDYEYDESGKIIKSVSDLYDRTSVTEFEYDDKDNLIKYTTKVNGNEKFSSITTKEYNEDGKLIKVESPNTIEEYTYENDKMTKVTKDIVNETETTEIFNVKENNILELVQSERFSVSKGYVDRGVYIAELKDNILRTTNYEDLDNCEELVPVHTEYKDMTIGKPIRIVDINDGSNGREGLKVEFDYNDENDIIKTRIYRNDELQQEEDTEISVDENGHKVCKTSGLKTIKYTKDGYIIVDTIYEKDMSNSGLKRQTAIISEDGSINLQRTISELPGPNGFPKELETICLSNPDYSIDMVDCNLIDVNIFVDGKRYEYGSDLYGGPGAYASVTLYNDDESISETTKIEYARKDIKDGITKYISEKVYKFIEENKPFKEILELAEVNYESLKG